MKWIPATLGTSFAGMTFGIAISVGFSDNDTLEGICRLTTREEGGAGSVSRRS